MNSRYELYGAGVFTTLRTYDRRPWLWDKHWKRLEHDAAAIGLDTSQISSEAILRRIDETILNEEVGVHKVRVTLSDDRPSTLWTPDERITASTCVSITYSILRAIPERIRLGISTFPVNSRSPLAGLKTCNYLEPLLAIEQARSNGCAEALRFNELGHVTSAVMANIFWLIDGRLFTPSLTTGCLAGTTREYVLENLEVNEVALLIDEIRDVDAVFLTSAGLGIVAVDEFDGRAMGSVDHPILDLMPNVETRP